jgi:uncharacterized protein YndB with AHSA1/START domain
MTAADGSRELSITRTFRAPKALVLEMWSSADNLAKWWGPFGFTITTHELDFRPGGLWRLTMHGPDGRDYPNHITYREITNDRISYVHAGPDGIADFEVVVSFEEEDSKTIMDFRMTFPTAEDRQRIVGTFGADKGLVETTTRLENFLAEVLRHRGPQDAI